MFLVQGIELQRKFDRKDNSIFWIYLIEFLVCVVYVFLYFLCIVKKEKDAGIAYFRGFNTTLRNIRYKVEVKYGVEIKFPKYKLRNSITFGFFGCLVYSYQLPFMN